MAGLRGAVVAGAIALGGCLPAAPPPGMALQKAQPHAPSPSLIELARVEPAPLHRALLVVYPRTGCSGSASVVFLDEQGDFIGAVAPGTATLLEVPIATRKLVTASSVEVSAPLRAWATADEVELPAAPAGLLVRSLRWNARECGNGQYAEVAPAARDELEETLAEAEVRWLVARPCAGQAWLEAHRARVGEVLAARRAPAPAGVLGNVGPLLGSGRGL